MSAWMDENYWIESITAHWKDRAPETVAFAPPILLKDAKRHVAKLQRLENPPWAIDVTPTNASALYSQG